MTITASISTGEIIEGLMKLPHIVEQIPPGYKIDASSIQPVCEQRTDVFQGFRFQIIKA